MTTQLLQIGFLAVDETTDPKATPPGTLVRADNCAMDKGRRLTKRDGTDGLVKTALSGSNIAAGKRLLLRGINLALTDGATAWNYVDTLSKWMPLDRPPSWRATKRPLVDSTRSVSAIDVAIHGDLLVSVYLTLGTTYLFYKIDSVSTGQTIVPPALLSATASKSPRVLIDGTTAHFFCSAAGTIEAWAMDLATLSTPVNPGSLVADARVSPCVFDVCIGTPTAGVPTIYMAYELAAGVNRTRTISFTASTMAAIAHADSAGTGIVAACISFGDAAQKVTLAWSHSTSANTKLVSFNTNLGGGVAGPDSIYAGASDYVFVAENDATNVIAGWTRNDGSGTDADRLTTSLYAVANGHAQVSTSERITFGLYFVSTPWRVAGRWFAAAVTFVHPYSATSTDKIAQPSSAVIEIETADSLTGVQDATHPHVGTLENQTGWYAPGLAQVKPTTDADGNIWIPAAYRNREPENYTTPIPVGWAVYKLEASGGDTFRAATLGLGALCAGAAPCWNDGASLMPYGFQHAPQIISVSATAGGAMAVGDYSYVATYAWRDANGVLHRSTPSNPKTGTTAGGNVSLTVKVATSSLSAKQRTLAAASSANPIFIELWRTVVTATGPHYRLSLEPSYQVLVNDPRAGDVSIVDTKADANIASSNPVVTLASQAQLYTETGELENVPPPSLTTCVTHQGRLIGIGPDLRTVWPSKDSRLDTTLAPGFNEALNIAFAHDKNALASLDDKLVVYGEDSIDVVYGNGPDDAGVGGWDARPLQTDVGCIEPRSVAVCPAGSVFLSRRGMELLGRDLTINWIGDKVVDTLAAYPNITSAVLVAGEQEVRWTCDNGSTGIVLAWDYSYQIWTVRRYNDAADTATDDVRFVDAALIDGVYTLLTAGGQVYRETDAHKLDNGTAYVERDVLLRPISPQGNLGWYRAKDVTVLGTSVTAHDLEVSIALDYEATFSQTHTFSAGTDVTTPGPLEKCRVTLAKQKCQAVQIRIRDLTPTALEYGTGDGPIIEALALRVGVLDGPAKVGIGQEA